MFWTIGMYTFENIFHARLKEGNDLIYKAEIGCVFSNLSNVFKTIVRIFILKRREYNFNYIVQRSSRCTLVQTSRHENDFTVLETFGVRTRNLFWCVWKVILKFETYTRYSGVADKKKNHRCFLLNLSLDIMRIL